MAGKSPDGAPLRAGQVRALLGHGSDLLSLVGADGHILYVSPSVERTLGYRPDQLLGAPCASLVRALPEDGGGELARELLAEPGAVRSGEVEVRHADGSWRHLEAKAVNYIDEPEVAAIVLTARDVTERKRIERELAASESSFRMLADNAHDVIARYSLVPEPRMVYISPSVERLTGYSPSDFYEDPHIHIRLIHPDDRSRLAVLMQGGIEALSVPITFRWIRKDGEIVWLEQVIVPILNADGALIGTEAISREVTAQVRLEEQLRRAQKLEAVGRLAGGIAHDFNNLLSVTTLSAQRLKRISNGDAVAGGLDMILTATDRGVDLIRQLLTFSRRAPTRVTSVRLGEVVESMRPMLRRLIREDIEISTELGALEDRIRIDRSQLEQIILNLAINARDAMPDGGALSLATERQTANGSQVARGDTDVRVPGERVALVVSDTGHGVSPDQRERIFDPFFTTKADGSGLGLAVVYGIVEQSGGRIDVESQPGRGARFCIDWPVASSEPEKRSEPRSIGVLTGSETILLVEDEPMIRTLTAEMLEFNGYRVLSAADGDEAQRICDDTERIDLLLTDVVMPGINGRALAERICARRPGLPVIFMSGYTEDEILRQGVSRESISFIGKPFTETQLLSLIRQALPD